MAGKTLGAVILEIMTSSGHPLTAQQVFDSITRRGLFDFASKMPRRDCAQCVVSTL